MLKKIPAFFYCFTVILTACNQQQQVHKNKITYAAISDTLYHPDSSYKRNMAEWKKVYETCMNNKLFPNAFYLGVQQKLHVGSITNISGKTLNDKINVFDTSHIKDIFSIFSPGSTSNCYTKLSLDKRSQNQFYDELKEALGKSKEYAYVNNLIDTTQMSFGFTTLSYNGISPDSLVSLLQTTTDSSLLEFKKLLLTPGNAMLTRDVITFGYFSDFVVKGKLSAADELKFSKEQFFTFGNMGESGSIKLLANHHLQVLVNKYYTVFGEFYTFNEAVE